MNDLQPSNEFRFKSGSSILNYIRQFSSTEKAIFGILVIVAIVSTILMAESINAYFMTEIPGYGGELREGIVGLPHTINPVLSVTDVDKDISALVYSGLMKYDGATIVPDIAKSYILSDDGLTYTFTLRPDVRFQDGTILTADDVAFTIQKIQDPALKSPRRADWTNVTVKQISPTKIQFTLKQAYAPFLTNTTIGIIPKHIWGTVGDDQFIFSQFNIQPIGAGPYKVSKVVSDGGGIPIEYHLVTWSGNSDSVPHLSAITFVFFSDEEKALSAIDNGTIDSLASISPIEAARLASDTAQPYKVLSTPLPRIFGVFFNQNQAPVLADKIVRQALDMSVDRASIVKSALVGYGVPLNGPLPNGFLGTSTPSAETGPADVPALSWMTDKSATTSDITKPNIAGAQALFEKNGWNKNLQGIYEKKGKKDVQTLSFDIYTANTPDLKQTAELVKNSWKALGANVSVKIFDPSDLYQNIIRARKYDALLFGEFIGKDRDAYAFWNSSQRNYPGLNVAQYANSKVDKVLDDIRTTNNDSSRTALYAQLDQLIRSDLPAVFLFSPDFIYAVPKALHNIELGTVTLPSDRWNSVGNWYSVTEKVWKVFTAK